MNCKEFQKELPELLLNPAAESNSRALEHLQQCDPCEEEYTSLLSAVAVMDAWQAPEPSAYFDQKLAVPLREEQAAPRLGFFDRLKAHLLFNTGRQFRPAVAGALAFALMLGGGSYASLQGFNQQTITPSATVNDLQTLDKNAQALQQMDQLLDGDGADDGAANAPS